MKILFLTSHLSIGGAEKVLFKQCQILKKYGHDVTVVCTDIMGYSSLSIQSLHIPVIDLSSGPRKTKSQPLINIFNTIDPDIVYINNSFFPDVIEKTKKTMRYKLVTQVHGCLLHQSRYPYRLLEAYKNWLDGTIVSHPKNFDIARSVCKCKLTTILNPVDKRFFDTLSAPRNNVIVFCGRISPEKSLISLSGISKIVKKSIPDLEVMIVGDAEDSCGQYKQKVIESFDFDDVPLNIIGFVDNCWDFVNQAKMSILLSVTEGFSNVLWESCALGIPFVSTSVGSSYLLSTSCVDINWDGKTFELPTSIHEGIAAMIINTMHQNVNPADLRRKALLAHEDKYEEFFINFINEFH